MTKIRIVIVAALAIASLLAGGVAAIAGHAPSHPVASVAGPRLCC